MDIDQNAFDAGVNMYDCTPCPKCRSRYRYPEHAKDDTLTVTCDACGHAEPWTAENGRPSHVAPPRGKGVPI